MSPERENFEYDWTPRDDMFRERENSPSVEEWDEDLPLVTVLANIQKTKRAKGNRHIETERIEFGSPREEHSVEEGDRENTRKVIFCFPDFNYLFIYFSFAIEGAQRKKDDNLGCPISNSRPKRKIKSACENNSYESGHNVALWR